MQDRSVHRNVVWDGSTNCDLPIEGCLWDLDIAVMLCTVGWHLVWKVGTKVVVLGGGQRGSFGEAGQTCQVPIGSITKGISTMTAVAHSPIPTRSDVSNPLIASSVTWCALGSI